MAKKDKPDPRAASNTDRQIGASVRARRLEISMSQERLGEVVGVTFQQIQKYEKGVNRVSASTLMDIADALEVAPEALLPRGKKPAREDEAVDQEAQAIARLFSRLNAEGRRMLTKVARSLAADEDMKLKDRR
jgi:transcriptional regulator with XRE-family HTH domain